MRCRSSVAAEGWFRGRARYGRGLASCRTEKGWSAPAFFTVSGGSVGFQIGGQAIDLIMLVMNKNGMKNLLESQFQLGADASAAAGPVGRHAEGNTDWKMRAEILTYSRARGLFAGVTLNGAVVKQDKDSTREFYGRMVPTKTSLTGLVEPRKIRSRSWSPSTSGQSKRRTTKTLRAGLGSNQNSGGF